MTLPMARDLSPFGVRVVTIAPGLFRKSFPFPLASRLLGRSLLYTITLPLRYWHDSFSRIDVAQATQGRRVPSADGSPYRVRAACDANCREHHAERWDHQARCCNEAGEVVRSYLVKMMVWRCKRVVWMTLEFGLVLLCVDGGASSSPNVHYKLLMSPIFETMSVAFRALFTTPAFTWMM